jgi:hypothetical protein
MRPTSSRSKFGQLGTAMVITVVLSACGMIDHWFAVWEQAHPGK